MPSTYSNLKIQLMATGENTTTWGNVTNTNLGTAIEEAIAGSAEVTFANNNQTLTLTDTNATQTARHMRLRCTGTTGGSTRDLVVPTIEKPYIVRNDCADSVVVKTAAGTGITIPAGKTMWVYADGTNVVDAVTHLTSLTLGTALAVADGGTGADTAATARVNLLPSYTGNGLRVLRLNSGATDVEWAIAASGTVTSVAMTVPAGFSVSGSPITSSGTLAVTVSDAATARATLGAAASGANTDITSLSPAAGLLVGAPSGGAQGSGTVNATGLFINGVAVGTGSGSVTSVAASGGTTGLTFSGSPITTSGTLTLDGTLAVANGGTGAGTAATARVNLLPSYTGNGLRVLRLNSDATDVEWATAASGTVTSVGGTGTVSGITLTGTVTSSGNLTLGGTLAINNANWSGTDLAVANGGTGASDAATARTNLGAAASGANTDITALDQDVTITATGTIAANSIGFRGLPQESKTSGYTLALADAGKHISITTGGITIPANSSVAFPVGTAIVIYNDSSSTQTIAITTDTLRQAGTANTGTRTLAQRGLATCVKVASTTWVVSGSVT
jgi:hypothetical protein